MGLLDNPFDPAREAALVTGAGNGIGRAIAQALVGEGVRTVFADVNQETVTAAIKASRPAGPRGALGWRSRRRRRPRGIARGRYRRAWARDAFRAQRLAAAQ